MKKQLQKKLYTCLPVGIAFIVTAMMFSASANAQIVYTDVIPDVTSTGTYNLDLNNDGTIDFVITHTSTTVFGGLNCTGTHTNNYIRVTPSGSNQVADYSSSYVTKLVLYSNIDSSTLTWNNISNQLLTSLTFVCTGIGGGWRGGYSGQWNNAVDGFVGLKLVTPGNIYYGWVRLGVASGAASFSVKDYAYNSIPNQSILAGQTIATGIIENSFASSINLFPNPADNHLTIALGSNNKKVEVTITDIIGKVIYTTISTDTQKVEVNTKDFAVGIYVVQIQAAGFIGTKIIVITK